MLDNIKINKKEKEDPIINDETKTTTEIKENKEEKEVAQEKEETKEVEKITDEIVEKEIKELIEEKESEIEERATKLADKVIASVINEVGKEDVTNRYEEIVEDLVNVKPISTNCLDLHTKRQIKNPPNIELSQEETAYVTHITQKERLFESKSRLEGSVLDIGAAGKFNPGIFTRDFAKDHEVAAFDIKSKSIERFEEINPNIPIIQGDAHNMPYDDKSFDTSYLGNVLQYHENMGKILDEAIRVAKKKVVLTLALNKQFPDHLFEFRAKICYRGTIPAFLVLEIIRLDGNKNDFDKKD